jgi:predicted acetyltransferase
MSFELIALSEEDISTYNDMEWEAFASATDTISLCFYPEGRSDRVRAYMHKNVQENLVDSSFSYVLVQDSDTGTPLAVACWYFQTANKSIEEVLRDEEMARLKRAQQAPVAGVNFVAIDEFCESQAKTKREVLGGRAHAFLIGLGTSLSARRRGAGTAALTSGLKKADEMGLPVYLEASIMGRPLYAKYGFQDVSIGISD